MYLPKYNYNANEDGTTFEFYSDGPNGTIRKLIIFTKVASSPVIIYNLAFGDTSSGSEDINDIAISNNADRDKVFVR